MRELELRRAVNATLMPGFEGPVLPAWLADELDDGLGSVCLFSTNVEDLDQLRALNGAIHAANPAAVIATDEEGGDVTRLHHRLGSPYPSMAHLGRLDDESATEGVGFGIGAELLDAGIDLNLAPVADVNSNPRNPVIGVRSFGADPNLAARHVAAYIRGLQAAGTAGCAKHFPGHGDTSTDSHRELPTITVTADVLAARELVPFRAAVGAGSLAMMTSHILVPALDPESPATLSSTVLDMLRSELGFTGTIVSDALDMAGASGDRGIPEAAVLALRAGVDLLCIGTDNTAGQLAEIRDHILAAIANGRLSEERVLDAASRVAALSAGIGALRDARGASLTRSSAGTVPHPPVPAAPRKDHTHPAPAAPREEHTPPHPAPAAPHEEHTPPHPAPAAPHEEHTPPHPVPEELRQERAKRHEGPPPLSPAGFWLRRPVRPVLAPLFLRLDSADNIAAGDTPWGVGPHLSAELEELLPGSTCATASDLAELASVLDAHADRPLVVQGRDLARVDFLRTVTAMVLQRRPDAVLVELGWPELPGDPPVDIATFGSGRGAAMCLIHLLAEGTR